MAHYKTLLILWETISKKILYHLGYGPSPMIKYKLTYIYDISIYKAAGAQYDIG